MKIHSIKIFKYSIPFVTPLKIFSNILLRREGFILKITYQNNNSHFGEIAPLPLISNESLDEAYSQLINLCKKLKNNEEIDLNNLYPSVLFGILSALDHAPIGAFNTHYSGLLYHDFNLSKFKPKLDTYKLKLSQLCVKEACLLVKNVKQKYPNLKLRLDINQAWSYSDAIYFFKNFTDDDFEYIEEPCKSIEETKKILKTTPHRIALDESLINWSFNELVYYKNIRALIIKPTLINYLQYLKCEIPLVFSSSFETGIGLLSIAKLANTHFNESPGLDTYKFLEYDILKKPLKFDTLMRSNYPISLNNRFLKQCFVA